MPLFNQSIRRKIVGIALGLIVLMLVTSILSMVMSSQVGVLLDELSNRYIPAYSHLARANIRSLERALALRRMIMTRMDSSSDEQAIAARRRDFEALDRQFEEDAENARKLINAIIDDSRTYSDNAALARLDVRIEGAVTELRHDLDAGSAKLLKQVETNDMAAARSTLEQLDTLRDAFNRKVDAIRADMLTQVFFSTSQVISRQYQAIIVSGVVTLLAAVVGFVFALLVSSGITRPVRLLLAGTREVEAGRFDKTITVSTQDEIGELAAAFNRMIEQLRHNERIRETFGRYIDPKVAQGLIDRPEVAVDGQRRVMTIMFADMSGFTSMSEGMTPRGLVKVMNHYFTVMSAPIRTHRGVIDKYIGDAVMAYWGPPFIDEDEPALLACFAALEMADQVPALQQQLPDLLGIRTMPAPCDLRVGIATGDVLTGSIGSELMMSFTVMGDAANLASRLEAVNKIYGTRILISQATADAIGAACELREIDRLTVAGQSVSQAIFEVMSKAGGLSVPQQSLRAHYAEGLAAYRARRFDEARAAFNAALEAVPGDGPSRALLARIVQFGANPPGEGWDGAWRLEQK
ncbi:HAMP domain-containing protein [Bradyrhizobium diazoefficiens]|nr:adenylate/guanylate cyclase domain-containing protein [Bradyrhizobium diazoefficiens]MBR0964555.1 HAMP domain-containing protein [Bradyrhizobium diazoefficiens]MBR0978715.1 HAMP domain-containing protein [Bradyrhizobium diazoefficiens]MBR1008266.1 HAMP domain-containing protein [Bradyrhizobium diazoefficiens]MBR1013802.1 HAMP domain-containing protein [Bradyrhizobium diazoefficiens]MBR1051147.1 HAMP domain-containing protein [Bradyrhizobium diazoefficiens]